MNNPEKTSVNPLTYIAWLQALVATLGSLFFSEVMQLVPCILCWYQRILMYPLVLIIGVGILRKDKNIPYYVLPLTTLGFVIALYHYLLQRGIIPDSLAPCTLGVSCTTRYIEYFGFITIPFMALIAFAVISVSMFIYLKSQKKYEN